MPPARGAKKFTLAGPPRNTTAVARLGVDAPAKAILPVTLKLAGQPAVFSALIKPFGEGTVEIRLRLPRQTPPGTYTGEAPIGGKQRPIVVEVESVTRLRMHPEQTLLSAEAGSKAEFRVTLVNRGNVPIDIPKAGAFDLDDDEGQDRALGRTLRAALREGERRVDRLFEEVRESHGGEARVTVRTGAGRLDPGDSCGLTCVLDVPATVQAGRSYLGVWEIANANHVIVVGVAKGSPPNNGR